MKKIFIDIGHGGMDPGAVGNNLQEKDIVLKMGLKIAEDLADNFVCDVYCSRFIDIFVTLAARVEMAAVLKADLFISLHVNSFRTPVPNGYEDFIHHNASVNNETIRRLIHHEISSIWVKHGRRNRGMKKANFAVLRNYGMPSLLVENGFIRNERDAKLLSDNDFLNELCDSHVRGIAIAMNLERAERLHIVKEGETLWSIAQDRLGRGRRWREILEINRLKTDILQVGQRLRLP